MPTPPLPAELHELIVYEIGKEIESDVDEDLHRLRKPLQACALVCRHWHIYTLPYRFGSMKFPMASRHPLTHAQQFVRLMSLAHLMGSDPLIGKSVRTLVLTADSGIPEKLDRALEEIAPSLQRVKNLTIISQHYVNLPRPFFDSALSIFLWGPQLEDLTFRQVATFRASSIAMSLGLKSITFIETRDVRSDHAGDPYPLPFLHKLVLIHSDNILNMMHYNPWFCALFGKIQDLDISFYFGKPPQWKDTLNWANIHTLSLSSLPAFPLADQFGTFFEEIPWASFSRLSSLKVSMMFYGPPYWRPPPTS